MGQGRQNLPTKISALFTKKSGQKRPKTASTGEILPEEYKRIRNYLGLVGPNTGDELVAECQELLGRNLAILYQIVGINPNDEDEWNARMRKSNLNNRHYTGQESKRCLCHKKSLAISQK